MLADSVGLGKTTTAISVLKQYIDNPEGKKRVEIICPKSLVQQWEKELATEGIYGLKPITLQNSGEIERERNSITLRAFRYLSLTNLTIFAKLQDLDLSYYLIG
jgi:SNF2 family DNA or RNA helicase